MRMFRYKQLGLIVGALFGWLIVHYGFDKALLVLVLGGVGWAAGKVFDGEIDMTQFARRREEEELE